MTRNSIRAALRLAVPPGAIRASLPGALRPQLARLAATLPEGGDWIYEAALEGYRLLCRFEHGRPQLMTRGGHDWSDRLPLLMRELRRLRIASGWLDGELVVTGRSGASDYNALQQAFDGGRGDAIDYVVFDLPFQGGYDLRRVGLEQRRAFLAALLARVPGLQRVRYGAELAGDAQAALGAARAAGIVSVIAKQRDAPYVSLRSELWLKVRCTAPAPRAAARRPIAVSHPERLIDPSSGATKLDVVRYYESVAERMRPHLAGRACTLLRAPEGLAGGLFFQKHAGTLAIPGRHELAGDAFELSSPRAIAGAAQMNAIEFHTGNARPRRTAYPDRVVFDLDPGEGLPWHRMLEAAATLRALLESLGLKAWLKTSGGRGLHVVVPIAARHPVEAVHGFARAVARELERSAPQRYAARRGAEHRIGKVYVDHQRNGLGATTAAAWSLRARPGLPISMPLHWEQLQALKSGAPWTLADAAADFASAPPDPWAGYARARQSIGAALDALGVAAT